MSPPKTLARTSIGKHRERGSVLVVAMVALVALAALGSLTVVTVRSSLSGTTHDQFKAVALSAAEAGISVGIDFARRNLHPDHLWSDLVYDNNEPPAGFVHPLPGNGAKPGEAGHLFSVDAHAWYQVTILNNIDDGPPTVDPDTGFITHAGYLAGDDTDGRIVIRSIGHGPNNASVRLEVEIQSPTVFGSGCNTNDSGNTGQTCAPVDGSVDSSVSF
jgi:hypothetical protein